VGQKHGIRNIPSLRVPDDLDRLAANIDGSTLTKEYIIQEVSESSGQCLCILPE
jgi:hypothetical protein